MDNNDNYPALRAAIAEGRVRILDHDYILLRGTMPVIAYEGDEAVAEKWLKEHTPENTEPETNERHTYIGDGVYAHYDGYGIWLRTGSPWSPDSSVYLEPSVQIALRSFMDRVNGDGK